VSGGYQGEVGNHSYQGRYGQSHDCNAYIFF
jgi:hypothetical protein